MIKKYVKRTIAIIMLFVLSFSIMYYFQTPYGHVVNIIQGFYKEEKNSIDVVFVGASEVSAGYSAPYAFSLFGYTSYPYSIDGMEIKDVKRMLAEIYSYQTPKLVVIDISCATSYSQKKSGKEPSRVLVDNIPMSKHKLELLGMYTDMDERVNSVFPFITHHGFIPDFEYIKFCFRNENILKGTYARSSKIENVGTIFELTEKKRALPDNLQKELTNLLEYCKKNNYSVVFTRFPNRVNNEAFLKRYEECNYILDFVSSRGFPVIDCMTKAFLDGVDYQNDFYTNDHLSINGQRKLTRYLGAILTEKYDIGISQLSSYNLKKWNESSEYVGLFYEYVENVEKARKKDEPIYIFETSDLVEKLDFMKEKKKKE